MMTEILPDGVTDSMLLGTKIDACVVLKYDTIATLYPPGPLYTEPKMPNS